MGSNFFDIPFRNHTVESDFSCRDGELESSSPSLHPSSPDPTMSLTPPLEFALIRETLEGWHILPDSFPAKTIIASQPSMDYWNSMASQLLSQFQSEASNQSLFVAPFYAMAAWKLVDGSYLAPSLPVRLTPNSDVPLVATYDDISASEMEFKIAAALCSLRLKIQAPEILREWIGKILSLEIFVSEPVHKYDTYHAFLPFKRISTDSYCECMDLTTGKIEPQRICSVILPMAWKANLDGAGGRKGFSDVNAEMKFHRYASIPLSEVDRGGSWCRPEDIGGHLLGPDLTPVPYSGILSSGDYPSVAGVVIIEGHDEEVLISTRPLKLSGAGTLKRVSRVCLRGNYTPKNITVSVYGSRDMLAWWCIAERKGGTVVSVPRSPFRFFKVTVAGFLASGETLQGLTIYL